MYRRNLFQHNYMHSKLAYSDYILHFKAKIEMIVKRGSLLNLTVY